jgi:ASC-1-like (ASCH) protein
MTSYHLVILKKPYLEDILKGKKSIECRLTMTRRYFFGRVQPGDRLFLKISSGPVCAIATVSEVKSFENLTPTKVCQIERSYNCYIGGNSEYWKSKMNCRFGLLVWLKDVKRIEPCWINKKDWRAWVVLTEKGNFGLSPTAWLDAASGSVFNKANIGCPKQTDQLLEKTLPE